MLAADRGTRDLLPPIEADQQEIVGPGMTVAGGLALASEIPLLATPSVMHPVADLPPAEQEGESTGSDGTPATMPIENTAPSIDTPHVPGAFGGEGAHVISISVAQNFSELKPPAITYREGAGSHEPSPDGHDPQDGHDRQIEPDGNGARPGVGPSPNDGGSAEIDDAHSIDVTQIAVVDQDASIMINGYAGEVVARLHMDQDLMMDQDADVSFTIDGEGHFAVLLDQEMRIDQEIEIDVEIFDVDGVLYVDLFLRDSVEIEQDTTIDVQISDGPSGSTVDVNQDIEFDQDVDIDIDIEDELEERYAVKVYVDVLQKADVDQNAVIGINDRNGQIETDIDAIQTADIDQQTILQADFALT